MSQWGPTTYGDPCRECGFSWSASLEESVSVIEAAPDTFSELVAGADGSERLPRLSWPLVAYVSHVADNLRIWAERLAGLAVGDDGPVAPYDQDLLAEARRYSELSLAGALWSLDRASADWTGAVARAEGAGVTLVHPDRGPQSLLDVARSNAHDTCHHGWDVRRILDRH